MNQTFDVLGTSLEPGVLLLEASAGTGKTWSLTTLAVRLLLEREDLTVDRLLLVTYTRKATDELHRRLRDRIRETEEVLRTGIAESDEFLIGVLSRWSLDGAAIRRLARARRDVDLARVRTIHGFCQDILKTAAFEAGLPLDGSEHVEGDALLRDAWRDAVRDLVVAGDPLISAAVLEFDIRDGEGQGFRALSAARRHPRERWWPVVAPLEEALALFKTAVEGLDRDRFAEFVRQSSDANEWLKDGEAYRRTLASLGSGPGEEHPAGLRALFRLDADRLRGKLKKAGKERLAGSPIEGMLEPIAAAVSGLRASLVRELCHRALDRYESLKERNALVDHDDVIARTRARLSDPRTGPSLARRVGAEFDVALVDEFQDTDADQWEIFRRLFATPRHLLLLVGDPKQAIYRFRGADIFAYLRARSAADRQATLTRNWRSAPSMVDAVNSMFARHPDQSFALPGIGFEPVRPGRSEVSASDRPLHLVWLDPPSGRGAQSAAENKVLGQLCRDVIRRREELDAQPATEDGKPRTLAVLVRKHRQARTVMRALREVGVDAILARGGDIHDSDAMIEWRIFLRSLLDPANLRLQRRARVTRLWGASLSDLGKDASDFGDVELLARLRNLWRERGVAAMAGELLSRRRTVHRWLGEDEGERMVTDLRHGLELLNRAENEHGFGPEALLRWAESEARSQDPESEERPLRLDRESDAVQVLTNFTSKGLEFDTVYLPYAWLDGDLPGNPPLTVHDPASGESTLDFAGDPDLAPQATLEELSSRLRMHYVELTRAREACVVYLVPLKRKFAETAAGFLLGREDREATGERGRWVREEIDRFDADPGELADRIRGRAESSDSILFRLAGPGDSAATTWPAPSILPPVALDFPPKRTGALRPRAQISYTALVRSLREPDVDLDDAPALSRADRADPSDGPARGPGAGIFGFARGARAGLCLHELLEHADFSSDLDDAERRRIDRLLGRHGLREAAAHPGEIDPVQVCVDLVERLRAERLPFGEEQFRGLARAARLDEWEFRVPVKGLAGSDLATLLQEHWSNEEWLGVAARRLARLPSRQLEGMLGGFVDLLFVAGGRWTVLDWKSNDLGSESSDYSQAAMRRAMVEHDYLVQVLLYTVAVHRYLRHRIQGYDYDRHFAGVSYSFLRGLCGDADHGWCNLRPPRRLIEALDLRLGGEA